jgi:hypothetical protein
VATTPLVVEKLIDIVSRSHGVPEASRTPVQASTTNSPRWYTATAIPPRAERFDISVWTFSVTGAKSGWTRPSIPSSYRP